MKCCDSKGPLHTRIWQPVTITSSTLIGGKAGAGPSSLQSSHYAWGTNGARECKMDVKSAWIPNDIKWVMFHGHLDYFQKPPFGGRPNTKLGDHGTQNAHNHWFILFYNVRGPAWIKFHSNSIWLRAWSHMASHYTWGPVTTLHDFGGVLGRPLDTYFLGSHNFMVTPLGSCVKWCQGWVYTDVGHAYRWMHGIMINFNNNIKVFPCG